MPTIIMRMTSQPGWFPDPWQPQAWRWWDGNTWTLHTSSTPPVAPFGTPGPGGQAPSARVRAVLIAATVTQLAVAPITLIAVMFLPARCRTPTCAAIHGPSAAGIFFGVPALLVAAWVTHGQARRPAAWAVGFALTSVLLTAAVLGTDIWLTNHS